MTRASTSLVVGRLLALFALLAVPGAAGAQRAAGMVHGTVVSASDRTPLPRARVRAVGREVATTTDAQGRFTLGPMAPGPVTLQVRLVGYRPAAGNVVVSDTSAVSVEIALDAAPVYLNEVRVLGARSARERFDESAEVGAISLGGAVVSAIPALGEPDVLRAVQLMPGVLGRHDYTAGYNVRGGESDQNLVLLDGIPVYNPFHLGGLFGTFIEPTVRDVTMLTGGFPATHGGRLSSVLDVTTSEEARRGVHGETSVSLLATTVALGGLLPDGRTTWNVAARRTYADAVIQAFTRELFPYHFRDGQLRLSHALPGGGTLSLTAYDGRDRLRENVFDDSDADDDSTFVRGDYDYDWGNTVAGVTWAQPIGERIAATQRASVSRFSSTLDLGRGSRILSSAITDWRLAGHAASQLGTHRVTAGYELSRLRVRYHDRSPRSTVTLQALRQDPLQGALFLDDVWQAGKRLIVRPGVRAERAGDAGWTGVSPRLALKYFATRDLAVTAAGGRVSQAVHSLRREDVPTQLFDQWLASDEHVPVSTATHLVLGAERWWGDARFARVEAFDKRYADLVEPDPADDPIVRGDEFRSVQGRAYGVDVLVRQLESRALSGWLAYSYTVSTRERGDTTFFATQDRRHNINAVGAWQSRRGWILGARFGLGTGTPYTPIVAELWQVDHDPASGQYGSGADRGDLLPVAGRRNSERVPVYHRLDLGISRRIVKPRVVLVPSLQLVNAYGRRNVFRYAYDYSDSPPTRRAVSQLPLLPTVGLTVEF